MYPTHIKLSTISSPVECGRFGRISCRYCGFILCVPAKRIKVKVKYAISHIHTLNICHIRAKPSKNKENSLHDLNRLRAYIRTYIVLQVTIRRNDYFSKKGHTAGADVLVVVIHQRLADAFSLRRKRLHLF